MHSQQPRRAQYCRHCKCHSMFRWVEPKHHVYSALTLALIGANAATPVTGSIMLALWLQRVVRTRRWACPHCERPTAAA